MPAVSGAAGGQPVVLDKGTIDSLLACGAITASGSGGYVAMSGPALQALQAMPQVVLSGDQHGALAQVWGYKALSRCCCAPHSPLITWRPAALRPVVGLQQYAWQTDS